MKECPFCFEPVASDAKFCEHCGGIIKRNEVDYSSYKSGESTEVYRSMEKLCPVCLKSNPETANWCDCGASLRDVKPSPKVVKKTTRRNRNVKKSRDISIAAFLLGLFLGLIGLLIVYVANKEKSARRSAAIGFAVRIASAVIIRVLLVLLFLMI